MSLYGQPPKRVKLKRPSSSGGKKKVKPSKPWTPTPRSGYYLPHQKRNIA